VVRVWLIRHGQSESNAGLPSADWQGIPLTELGHQQAARIAGVFTDPPKLIVSSPYLRAQQTAQPTIYVPYAQHPSDTTYFALRTRGDALALAPAARRAIHDVDPDLPVKVPFRSKETFEPVKSK